MLLPVRSTKDQDAREVPAAPALPMYTVFASSSIIADEEPRFGTACCTPVYFFFVHCTIQVIPSLITAPGALLSLFNHFASKHATLLLLCKAFLLLPNYFPHQARQVWLSGTPLLRAPSIRLKSNVHIAHWSPSLCMTLLLNEWHPLSRKKIHKLV